MKLVKTIEGCDWIEPGDGTLQVIGFCRCETDGSGQHHGDKTAQNETTYRPPLNADEVYFVSIPMVIAHLVQGVVIGCLVVIEDLMNGRKYAGVCGDLAPNDRTGECSYRLVKDFGLNPDPNIGGDDTHRKFRYTFHPGTAAPGYKLQPLG